MKSTSRYVKDGIAYVYCPECGGEGRQMHGVMYPSGHHEIWLPCEFCEGEGDFEEADYLVLKLEGKV
jgi:DnaJ-class molecular chaperone